MPFSMIPPGQGALTDNAYQNWLAQNAGAFPWLVNPGAPTSSTSGPGATAPPGTLPGAAPRDWTPAAGGVPFVPNPTRTARNAARGNLRNLPLLTNLANQLNNFNYQQLVNQYEAGIPGFQNLLAANARNIGGLLGNELSPEEQARIIDNAATFGISTGAGALIDADSLAGMRGLMSTNQTLAERQKLGTALLGATTQFIPKVTPFDVSSQFVTPAQQQAAQTLANILASAPSPQAAQDAARALATLGLRTGFSSVPGANTGGTTTPPPSSNLSGLQDLFARYLSNSGGIPPPSTTTGNTTTTPPPATTPTTPGWGYTTGPAGTFGSTGGAPFQIGGPPGQTLPASTSNVYDWLYGGV